MANRKEGSEVMVSVATQGDKKELAGKIERMGQERGIRFPSDSQESMISIYNMITTVSVGDYCNVAKVLEELEGAFGLVPGKSKKRKREGGDDATPKKPKKAIKPPKAKCPENQIYVTLFWTLAHYVFLEVKETGSKPFKALTFRKVAKAIAEHDAIIKNGKEAKKLKGVGKGSADIVDKYIAEGEEMEDLVNYKVEYGDVEVEESEQ